MNKATPSDTRKRSYNQTARAEAAETAAERNREEIHADTLRAQAAALGTELDTARDLAEDRARAIDGVRAAVAVFEVELGELGTPGFTDRMVAAIKHAIGGAR